MQNNPPKQACILREYLVPISNAGPYGLAAGCAGSLSFTASRAHAIGRLKIKPHDQAAMARPRA